MREILFRGKRNDDGGEWHYGGYIHDDSVEPNAHIIMEHRGGMFRCVPVLPETVGQYTGLTDKNGKKIFEGDIIKTRRSGTRIEKLKGYYGYDSDGYPQKIPGYNGFSEYSYSCEIDCYAKVEYDPMNGGFWLNGGDVFVGAICNEVVGNIHDNTELLEVSNNE